MGDKAKHTPGPWELDGLAITSSDGSLVCLMGYPAMYPGDIAAVVKKENANLVEAAPDMYEALKSCLHALEHTYEGNYRVGATQKAREALAKAEGREDDR